MKAKVVEVDGDRLLIQVESEDSPRWVNRSECEPDPEHLAYLKSILEACKIATGKEDC